MKNVILCLILLCIFILSYKLYYMKIKLKKMYNIIM